MENKQDIFDKLMQVKEDYEPAPYIPDRVIEKINQREATVTFKRAIPKWVWYALIVFVVAAVIVFLSVYFTRSDIKITLYTAENIEIEDIDNINSFVSDNSLNCRYFNYELANNRIAKIKNTDTLSYIMQEFDDIGENGLDYVKLKVVLLQNAEFEFYSLFNSLSNSVSVFGIEIQYATLSNASDNMILAKFEFEKKSYFLEIETNDSGTSVLEKYINQLLK